MNQSDKMTQASLFGDIPNDFQVTAHSDVSDDDENLDEKVFFKNKLGFLKDFR